MGCADPEQTEVDKEIVPSDVYELVNDWPKLPEDFLLGNPTGLGIDSGNNIVVFHRASRGWQEPMPENAVAIDNQNDHLFGIDYYTVNDTTVKGSDIFRFDLDTNLQVQFGRTCCYDGPISRYHDILIDDEGSIYVGDILGNSVQKFRLITSMNDE